MKSILTVIMCFISILVVAQVESVFNDIHFGESLSEVKLKIAKISESSLIISPSTITFPLSKEKEQHLLCSNVKINNGKVKKVALVFADDKLVHIEIRGNAIKTIFDIRTDEAITYFDYKAYFKDLLFGNIKNDVVWMITQDGAHVSLFTWYNPYINNTEIKEYNPSAKIPEYLKLGDKIDNLQPIFEEKSLLTKVDKLDGSDPNADTQINCFGLEYSGFPRKIEARFGNGILNSVWILTGKAEEDRIRKKLIESYGKQILVTDDYEVFNDWRVLLRKDKSEFLLLNDPLIPIYKRFLLKEKHLKNNIFKD